MSANPAGYHTLTPYVVCRDAVAAIAFYRKAFGATEVMRLTMPDGSIAHAEIQIGDSKLMIGEENPAWGSKSPQTLGGSPAGFCLYVPDADAAFATAIAEGATVERPVEDQFYGDRSGSVIDPFGHKWSLATRVEEVPVADMQRRMDEWLASMPMPAAA